MDLFLIVNLLTCVLEIWKWSKDNFWGCTCKSSVDVRLNLLGRGNYYIGIDRIVKNYLTYNLLFYIILNINILILLLFILQNISKI